MNINTMFPKKYATGDDLVGKNPTLRIKALTKVVMRPGGVATDTHILWLHNASKGIILTAPLARNIAAIHGPETDAWIGKRITLYAEPHGGSNWIRARAPEADTWHIVADPTAEPTLTPLRTTTREQLLATA